MKQKCQVRKTKKISITLPEREGELLAQYAKELGTTRPAAAHRILREFLRQYKPSVGDSQPQNQLGLFDTIQIDIFNNTSKSSD